MSDQTALGTLAGITEKPTGWTTIEVSMPGKQYPLKMDTKIPELIELARAAAGSNVMEWSYNESESEKMNEHTGKPYMNRYFNGVKPPGSSPNASVSPSSAPKDEMTKDDWARKDSAIHKMACIKTAAAALTHTLPSDPTEDDLRRFLQREAFLSTAWHRSVLGIRDGADVPFEEAPLSAHDDEIPFGDE